jgi:hypothetical protein
MGEPLPYHVLADEVRRLRSQVDSLLPFGRVMLAAEERAQKAERRAQEAELAMREAGRIRDGALGTVEELRERIARLMTDNEVTRRAYRRGYGTGYTAAKRGAEADPDGAMNRGRGRPRSLAVREPDQTGDLDGA